MFVGRPFAEKRVFTVVYFVVLLYTGRFYKSSLGSATSPLSPQSWAQAAAPRDPFAPGPPLPGSLPRNVLTRLRLQHGGHSTRSPSRGAHHRLWPPEKDILVYNTHKYDVLYVLLCTVRVLHIYVLRFFLDGKSGSPNVIEPP